MNKSLSPQEVNERILETLKDILILGLARESIPQSEIAKLVGVSTARVNRIASEMLKVRKKMERYPKGG